MCKMAEFGPKIYYAVFLAAVVMTWTVLVVMGVIISLSVYNVVVQTALEC